MKIQHFTKEKRHPIMRVVYGFLLVIIGSTLVLVNPLELVTNWFLEIKEGSFVFGMWEKPTYELFSEVWVFNYTNVPRYLAGEDQVMKIQEIGPFTFQETRTNENVTVDKERGVLKMKPKVALKFLPEQSIARAEDVQVYGPNIALIALSTLAADNLGYFANAGAYYSINALGSKLFRNLTVDEVLWGYDDPMVSIANNLLPGWIDFGKIGILDRFYAQKSEGVEIELKDTDTRYSIVSWNGSPGLAEQGYTDMNTSSLCNRIQGSYEGFMLSPNFPKDKTLPIFRQQACRIYPFSFAEERTSEHGYTYNRYDLEKTAFSKSSPYACNCTKNCLPEGFVDVSKCYYGFPITLSKPHFMDADPEQAAFFEGLHPNVERHTSRLDLQPTIGVPLALASNMQVNIAVRMSPGNPITKPLKDKVMPLIWLSLYCKEAPPNVVTLLKLRFVIAPPLLITIEILLFLIGFLLGIQGAYRIWRKKYTTVSQEDERLHNNNKQHYLNVSENIGFKDDVMAKQGVSLLAKKDDMPELVVCDDYRDCDFA